MGMLGSRWTKEKDLPTIAVDSCLLKYAAVLLQIQHLQLECLILFGPRQWVRSDFLPADPA